MRINIYSKYESISEGFSENLPREIFEIQKKRGCVFHTYLSGSLHYDLNAAVVFDFNEELIFSHEFEIHFGVGEESD
jgi:hypothetical protein